MLTLPPLRPRPWTAQAEGHCLGCDLTARTPEPLRMGVHALEWLLRAELAPLPSAQLEEMLEAARERAVDGLCMADWLVAGTPRPKGAKPVVEPLARFVACIHVLADRR